MAGEPSRNLWKEFAALPLSQKLGVARGLLGDGRVPLTAKLIIPALLLYLAMPLDLIPDFIPVLGQLDDLLISALGFWVFLRLCPRPVLEEYITAAPAWAWGGIGGAAFRVVALLLVLGFVGLLTLLTYRVVWAAWPLAQAWGRAMLGLPEPTCH